MDGHTPNTDEIPEPTKPSRRQVLRASIEMVGAGLLAACGVAPASTTRPTTDTKTQPTAAPTVVAADAEPTPVPTPQPQVLGQGDVNVTMWVQDFPPLVDLFKRAAQAHVEKGTGTQVTVQPVPYGDLQAKLLPAIAAGTEPDIIYGLTDWFVATDISKLFLPLDDYIGGRAAIEKVVYPTALTTLDTPENKMYYLPVAAGVRGASITINEGHYKEKGIDYTKFTKLEDYIEAAKELTVTEGGVIKRAGISMYSAVLSLVKTWIWQMGEEFYNREQGKWSLASSAGEEALQRIYDTYWNQKVSSLDIFSEEYQGFLQGLASAHFDGAWTMGVMEEANPELDLDVMPTPKLANAKVDVVYPEHLVVVTLSRRLANDKVKLDPCIEILMNMLTADALVGLTESYSGTVVNQTVYEDPRVMQTKYGPYSKRVAEGVWPRARFPQDRVANQGPAQQELRRALTKEISIKDALANADRYLNEQEAQVMERLRG